MGDFDNIYSWHIRGKSFFIILFVYMRFKGNGSLSLLIRGSTGQIRVR